MENDAVALTTQMLHARGERMGHARRAIIEVLAASSDPLSVDDLVSILGERSDSVHRASVYRGVEGLHVLGLVQRILVGNAQALYKLAPIPERRVLVRCGRCQTQIWLPKSVMDPVKEALVDGFGFQLHPCHVALTGVCQACRTPAEH